VSHAAGVALIVIGIVSIALGEVVRRRGAVAEPYGGARAAPFWRWFALVFGVALIAIGFVRGLL
jgi:hypothetical protein